jgi:hypothetical protein
MGSVKSNFFRLLGGSGTQIPAFECRVCNLSMTLGPNTKEVGHCGRVETVPTLDEFRRLKSGMFSCQNGGMVFLKTDLPE